jgi:hypothetical protein
MVLILCVLDFLENLDDFDLAPTSALQFVAYIMPSPERKNAFSCQHYKLHMQFFEFRYIFAILQFRSFTIDAHDANVNGLATYPANGIAIELSFI